MKKKTIKTNPNNRKLFAGVDLHNESFQIHVIDDNETRVHSGKVSTNEADIQRCFEPYREYEMPVAVEIGNPTFWFSDILEKMGYDVNIVNVLDYSRTSNNKRKNDKQDAKNLALDLRNGNLPKTPVFKPNLIQRNLRAMLTARHQKVGAKTRLVNQTYSFLCGRGIKVKKGSLTKSLKNWEALFARLKGNVDLESEEDKDWEFISDKDLEFVTHILEFYHKDFKHLYAQILYIEDCIRMQIKAHYQPIYNRLVTLPGIGIINAVSMIALVGDWSRFKSGKAFAAYFGVTPGYRKSAGNSLKGDGDMTKEGSAKMRSYLIQGALAILRSKSKDAEPLKIWYQQIKLRRGWKKARVALARKMCEIAFAMIRKGADYDPSLLIKNN